MAHITRECRHVHDAKADNLRLEPKQPCARHDVLLGRAMGQQGGAVESCRHRTSLDSNRSLHTATLHQRKTSPPSYIIDLCALLAHAHHYILCFGLHAKRAGRSLGPRSILRIVSLHLRGLQSRPHILVSLGPVGYLHDGHFRRLLTFAGPVEAFFLLSSVLSCFLSPLCIFQRSLPGRGLKGSRPSRSNSSRQRQPRYTIALHSQGGHNG